jgi:hypothetical protein
MLFECLFSTKLPAIVGTGSTSVVTARGDFAMSVRRAKLSRLGSIDLYLRLQRLRLPLHKVNVQAQISVPCSKRDHAWEGRAMFGKGAASSSRAASVTPRGFSASRTTRLHSLPTAPRANAGPAPHHLAAGRASDRGQLAPPHAVGYRWNRMRRCACWRVRQETAS